MSHSIVLVTTTYYTYKTEYERVRAKLFWDLVKKAHRAGYLVIAVDAGSAPEFLDVAHTLPVTLIPQREGSLGVARRQCIEAGVASGRNIIVYTDPEKNSFVSEIEKSVQPLIDGVCDFVVPRRRSMESYPRFQAYSERFINLYWKELTGWDLDITFGPRCFQRELADLFLTYEGRYGDKWDSIFIPVMRGLKDGVRISEVEVDFVYPASQRDVEENDLYFYDKRLEQVNNLITAFKAYWKE
jgi:hypothetical protein